MILSTVFALAWGILSLVLLLGFIIALAYREEVARCTRLSPYWIRFLRFISYGFLALLFGGGLIVGVADLWNYNARTRTATVRQVFLHGANLLHFPEVYMNDGTVWVITDYADHVRMISGDKVRYENEGAGDAPICKLYDVTTGYLSYNANRISAPFEHTSCPAQAPF
jgi:hypothetical protein